MKKFLICMFISTQLFAVHSDMQIAAQKQIKVTKAVIPVGGRGTRFLPFTKTVPKELVPIANGKPSIQYVVEEAESSGINECLFITSGHKDGLFDYFNPNPELDDWLKTRNKFHFLTGLNNLCLQMNFRYVNSLTGLGVGYAVLCAQPFINDEYFAAMWPDNVMYCDVPCIRQLIEVAQLYGGSVIAVEEVSKEDMVAYGMVEIEKDLGDGVFAVSGLKQKPVITEVTSNLAVIGRFVLSSRVFDYLDRLQPGRSGEYWLTDALDQMVQNGEPVFAYVIKGRFFDTGTPKKWAEAVAFYTEHEK